jgi:hypothetical protein
MKNIKPKEVNISYPIVPANVFGHHTDDLEVILTMLICRIHESKNLGTMELLSDSSYTLILATRLTAILAHYQGDLIHAYTPEADEQIPDYM